MKISQANIQQAVELLQMLISTPSISRDESELADRLQVFIQRSAPFVIDMHRHINNIWCLSPDFNPQKPTLLLDAHIDTVKPVPEWSSQPFTPIIDGDKITGLGANDDGGSVACLLQIFYLICQSRQQYNTIFLASAEEEVSGKNGIESVIIADDAVDISELRDTTELTLDLLTDKGVSVLTKTFADKKSGKNASFTIYESGEKIYISQISSSTLNKRSGIIIK